MMHARTIEVMQYAEDIVQEASTLARGEPGSVFELQRAAKLQFAEALRFAAAKYETALNK